MNEQGIVYKLSKPFKIARYGFKETITEIDLNENNLSVSEVMKAEAEFTILEKRLSEDLGGREGDFTYPPMAKRTSAAMTLAIIKTVLEKKHPRITITYKDIKENLSGSDFMKIIMLRECQYFVKLNELQEMLMEQGMDLIEKFTLNKEEEQHAHVETD